MKSPSAVRGGDGQKNSGTIMDGQQRRTGDSVVAVVDL